MREIFKKQKLFYEDCPRAAELNSFMRSYADSLNLGWSAIPREIRSDDWEQYLHKQPEWIKAKIEHDDLKEKYYKKKGWN